MQVRHITKKISELSSQIDSFISLKHPRENAYIICKTFKDTPTLENTITTDIYTSTTFPPLCSLKTRLGSLLCAGLEVNLILETRDYHNQIKKVGGDPITVKVSGPNDVALPPDQVVVEDNQNGTYDIKFTPFIVGTYQVYVEIFDRPIKEKSHEVEITLHNNPVKIYDRELCQPVSVVKGEDEIFILDTGNARIVVLDSNVVFKRVLENDSLKVCRLMCTW